MPERKKKKILYLITKSNFGGAQRYVYDLATNLPKERFEIAVAFGPPGGQPGAKGKLEEMLDEARIRTVPIPRLGRDIRIMDELAVFFDLYFLFRRERPDVIHLNSSKIGGLGAFAGRLARVPKILFTAHGWAFQESRPWWQTKLIWLSSWLTALFSHRVITVSKNDLRRSPRFLLPRNRTSCIHIGAASVRKIGRPTARSLFARQSGIKLPPNAFTIGVIAELHRNKGLFYLISALAQLEANTYLVSIGEGEERARLEKHAADRGLGGRVIFAGFLPNAGRLLPAFDAFVLPSLKEGLPYTLLEAAHAALPVVATSVGGIPEVIEDMKTGVLVRPRQPKELASAIRFFMQNNDKAAEFGRNLEERTRAEFSLEKMLAETIALY